MEPRVRGAVVSVDELMPRAREAWADGARSKNALRKNLRVAWDRADEVFSRLSAEEQQEQQRKGQQRRATLTRLRTRKRSGRTPRRVAKPLLATPTSPGVGPVSPWSYAVPVRPTEEPPPPMEDPRPAAPAEPLLKRSRPLVTWPVLLVAGGAFVAIWAGWVSLGKLTGFGKVNLLPGFWSGWTVDTAITLPLGMEAYSAYAFYVWLHHSAPRRARRFAAWSSLGAVLLGMGGQTAYHLMAADGMTAAPWQITTVVSCLPVAVFGLAAALVHMVRAGDDNEKEI